ncbi:MAG: hypothetical protein K940chlam7_01150 [Chlamydiae bacterium]|nr:hypothetical protein [Chlamydiota bacterium]
MRNNIGVIIRTHGSVRGRGQKGPPTRYPIEPPILPPVVPVAVNRPHLSLRPGSVISPLYLLPNLLGLVDEVGDDI